MNITPIQAYELALNIIRMHEEEWEAYLKEEARRLTIFDDDNEK